MKINAVDRKLIIVFSILAAIRVFIYSSAFPFFSNVDEQSHFDLVIKYGLEHHVPLSLEKVSPKSVEYIVNYGSPEYLCKPADVMGKQFSTPIWKMPEENAQRYIDERVAVWSSKTNHESLQPPVYYMIAGTWTELGSLFGIKGGFLLYWIRYLNVLLVVALVWIAYFAALRIFPENRFIVLGVPLLAAILPQDTYYSIQSDVLSPICFGLAFIGMIGFIRDTPSSRQGIIAGLSVAATVLTKISNMPLLIVVLVLVMFKLRILSRTHKLVSAARPIGLFVFCALMPVFIWFAWNLSMYGDVTASDSKIQLLGWTPKPFFDWFSHPIFTPHGAWIFWSTLMSSFWRGEFVWELTLMTIPAFDVFYWLSSLVLVVLAMINIRRSGNDFQRRMNWLAFWSFASLVIFMVVLSVSFDFGRCFYPSQKYPYFTSGRLLSAALVPFLLLYVQGLNFVFSWIKNECLRFGVLIAIALLITLSEFIVSWPVFSSQYNFFHM